MDRSLIGYINYLAVLIMLINVWEHRYLNKNIYAVLDASKEVNLDINAEKTKYCVCPCCVTIMPEKK
jgi:hypothetical protein